MRALARHQFLGRAEDVLPYLFATVYSEGNPVQRPELGNAAMAQRMKVEPDLWALLTGRSAPADLAASAVQFALLPDEAARWDRPINLSQSELRW